MQWIRAVCSCHVVLCSAARGGAHALIGAEKKTNWVRRQHRERGAAGGGVFTCSCVVALEDPRLLNPTAKP